MTEKACTQCSIVKPLDDFPPNRFHSDGRQSYCRECNRSARREAHRADPSRDRRYNKAYNAALRALADAHSAEFRALLDENLQAS